MNLTKKPIATFFLFAIPATFLVLGQWGNFQLFVGGFLVMYIILNVIQLFKAPTQSPDEDTKN